MKMMEKHSRTKREERTTAPASVEVMWHDRFGREKYAIVQSFDISASGMRLSLPEPVAIRSLVQLQCLPLKIHGTASVRHCEPKPGRYLVGLEFLGGLKWKPPAPPAAEAAESELQELDRTVGR